MLRRNRKEEQPVNYLVKKNQVVTLKPRIINILTAMAPYTIIALIVNMRREIANRTQAFSALKEKQ